MSRKPLVSLRHCGNKRRPRCHPGRDTSPCLRLLLVRYIRIPPMSCRRHYGCIVYCVTCISENSVCIHVARMLILILISVSVSASFFNFGLVLSFMVCRPRSGTEQCGVHPAHEAPQLVVDSVSAPSSPRAATAAGAAIGPSRLDPPLLDRLDAYRHDAVPAYGGNSCSGGCLVAIRQFILPAVTILIVLILIVVVVLVLSISGSRNAHRRLPRSNWCIDAWSFFVDTRKRVILTRGCLASARVISGRDGAGHIVRASAVLLPTRRRALGASHRPNVSRRHAPLRARSADRPAAACRSVLCLGAEQQRQQQQGCEWPWRATDDADAMDCGLVAADTGLVHALRRRRRRRFFVFVFFFQHQLSC